MGLDPALAKGKPGKDGELVPRLRVPVIPLALRLALGLPLLASGLFVAALPWSRARIPIWIFPHGLTLIGLALVVLALDAPPEGADRIPDGPLANRRLLRLGALLAAINSPLGFYLTMGAELRTVGPQAFVAAVAAINLLAAWAVGIFTPRRLGPRAVGFSPGRIDDERLLALHAATLSRPVVCPFCREAVDPGSSVACTGCETLHHDECWRENGRCTTYACGGTRAADFAGTRLA